MTAQPQTRDAERYSVATEAGLEGAVLKIGVNHYNNFLSNIGNKLLVSSFPATICLNKFLKQFQRYQSSTWTSSVVKFVG